VKKYWANIVRPLPPTVFVSYGYAVEAFQKLLSEEALIQS